MLSRVRLFVTLWTVAARPLCPWDFSGKNIGVGCHFLLQGIFPAQGSNPRLVCLLHLQVGFFFYQLSHCGSPILRGGGMYLRWTGKASLIVRLNGDNREVILERVTLWLQGFYPRFFPCLGHSATRELPDWVPNLIQVSLLHTSFLVRPSQTLPLENCCTPQPVSPFSPYLISFHNIHYHLYNQFSSVTQSCPTLHDPMNCSMPGLPIHYQLLESTQTHVHWVSDAIQLSQPLLSPSPPALNLSQHQGLLKWVSSLHQVAKVLKFQLQHQSLQWTPRTDLL